MTNINNNDSFNPTYDEIIEELGSINSRLLLENIALKIRIAKMQEYMKHTQEVAISKDEGF